MPGKSQPLFSNDRIVNPDGSPTLVFIRWAQQRQIDITQGITLGQAQALVDDFATDRTIIAGSGLVGGGDFTQNRTIAMATPGGFGSLDFTDLDSGTPLTLPSATWVNVSRNLIPSTANFNLPKGPWANFNFYTGGLFRARAVGDLYLFNFEYKITSTLANANARFLIQPPGFPEFAFGTGALIVGLDAGKQSAGAITFFVQARTRFVANGGQVMVRLSCDGTLDEFSPEITPLGYA